MINSKKKVLIFGASGDIGRYLTEYLDEYDDGIEVIAVGRRKDSSFIDKNITYYSLDITKKETFDVLPKGIHTVIDLAGIMPARMKGYQPQQYFEINTIGTLNILEYCRVNRVERFLFATSFGDLLGNLSDNNFILKPDSPINFSYTTDHTVYIISKLSAVELLKNYHYQYDLKTFVFRFPTIYLWSESDSFCVDGVERKSGFRLLIDKALKGEDIEVFGDPNRVKDMVYVKDLCQMFHKAIYTNKTKGTYNVGTGIGTSLLDIIKGIVTVFGDSKSKLIMRPDKPNTPQYIMDIENAIEDLGYQPQYDYYKMLEDMKQEMSEKVINTKKK